MKLRVVSVATLAMLLFLTTTYAANGAAFPQEEKVEPQKSVMTDDGKVKFTYQDVDWQEVIPWFADQAGFTLQPVDDWPEGTFSLQDSEPYTVLEALDQLNHSLRIREPAYTLIRNRKMLILAKIEDANFPSELIETVSIDDLDERGFYEVIKCRFDLGDLDPDLMYEELQPMIREENRRQFSVYPASNQLFVRETGEQLRNIRDLIEAAKKRMNESERKLVVYRLQYQDAETFLAAAGPQLGIQDGASNADGTLSITAEPLGERLFVSGTRKMLDRFSVVAELVDSDPNESSDEVEIDLPYLRTYPVLVDPKLAFDLLQTMLEGSEARMGQDEDSGAITVLGTAADHKLAEETLGVISSTTGDEFAIVKLEKIDAVDALTILQNVFRQDTLSEDGGSSGPVLLADSYLGQIMVSGTVQEVATVRNIVRQIDQNYDPLPTGPRTGTRMIPMSFEDQERLVPLLPDILGTTGRDNPFNIVKPEERKSFNERIRKGEFVDPAALLEEEGSGLIVPPRRTIPKAETPDQREGREGRSNGDQRRKQGASLLRSAGQSLLALTALKTGISPASAVLWQEDDAPATTDDRPLLNPDYTPPPKKQSVPGAPIQFRFTEYGLTIESDDLDAADDLETAIRDFLGEESAPQKPSFFYLQHRPVAEVKQLLEEFFGMADSGGGGGGGGGLVGGMMNNMMGGAGDLLGGLLDTGLSDDATIVLEGDVAFGIDPRFNGLWVRGATANDLAQINQLIDLFDQPDGPIDPDLPGKFRTIDVIHRDAAELVDMIRAQLPDLIFDPNAKQASGGGNNEMAQMMKAMQQLTRGGKSSGSNSADVEKMKAKAMLGADELTNQLLITGPDHIYQKIYEVVLGLDKPDLSEPKASEMVDGVSGFGSIKQTLKQMYGSKLIIEDPEEEEGGQNGSSGRPGSTNASNTASSAAQKAAEAQRAAFINAMRNGAMSGMRQSAPRGAVPSRGGSSGRGGRGGR